MNSEYEKKSLQELKAKARAEIQTAEHTVPCVTVTEQNWSAMIGLQKTQYKMLSDIMERQMMLTTEASLGKMLTQQNQTLARFIQDCTGLTEDYTEQMTQNMMTFSKQMNTVMSDMSSQAGKMKEQFSQALSSEQAAVKTFRKRSILLSMIPTVALILWELIWHIFSVT